MYIPKNGLNMKVKKEIRKVAIRWPAASWVGQENPDDDPYIVSRADNPDFFTLLEVGPQRGDPYGRMIYGVFHLDKEQSEQGWLIVLRILTEAITKPVLYSEDFSNRSTALIKNE